MEEELVKLFEQVKNGEKTPFEAKDELIALYDAKIKIPRLSDLTYDDISVFKGVWLNSFTNKRYSTIDLINFGYTTEEITELYDKK